MTIRELEDKVKELRKQIMEVGYRTKAGHLSSALSCLDFLVALYYGGYLQPLLNANKYSDRNHFILSKGHACIAQFLILADLGIIEEKELHHFCQPGSILGAHPDCLKVPGIETSTGALGHGLPIAVGMAIAEQYKQSKAKTYVIIGDGESQEGSIWEAAICAAQHRLSNLTVIVDYNRMQATGFVEEISDIDPLGDKWKSFGFAVREIDGHNMRQIMEVLGNNTITDRPQAIIAHTIKGKGVTLIENKKDWHGRKPNDSEWEIIKTQLGI